MIEEVQRRHQWEGSWCPSNHSMKLSVSPIVHAIVAGLHLTFLNLLKVWNIQLCQILWWSILLRNLGRKSLPSGLGNECHKGNIDTKLFIDGNTLPYVTKSKSVIQILQLLYCHVFKSGGDICYFLVELLGQLLLEWDGSLKPPVWSNLMFIQSF